MCSHIPEAFLLHTQFVDRALKRPPQFCAFSQPQVSKDALHLQVGHSFRVGFEAVEDCWRNAYRVSGVPRRKLIGDMFQ